MIEISILEYNGEKRKEINKKTFARRIAQELNRLTELLLSDDVKVVNARRIADGHRDNTLVLIHVIGENGETQIQTVLGIRQKGKPGELFPPGGTR